jgi:hypothetical protein
MDVGGDSNQQGAKPAENCRRLRCDKSPIVNLADEESYSGQYLGQDLVEATRLQGRDILDFIVAHKN